LFIPTRAITFICMSLAEIKTEIQQMPDADLAELEFQLKMTRLSRDPDFQARIQKGLAQFERGEFVTEEQLREVLAKRSV
jgi:hypothetical protein